MTEGKNTESKKCESKDLKSDECNSIYPSKHVNNLGVNMDRLMLFDVHINKLNKKSTVILKYINIIGDSLDEQTSHCCTNIHFKLN